MRREYRGGARAATLTQPLGGSTANQTIFCDDLSNWPTGVNNRPFYVVIGRNTTVEEKILCASRSGNVITIFNSGLVNGRGADDTTISAHSTGSIIEHVFTATDANEANLHVNTPSAHITPVTSATRPNPGATNQVILETDTGKLLGWLGGAWLEITGAGATGGGTNQAFYENDSVISANYTITNTKNAGTFGPVTINSGVTVTVPAGSTWSVV